MLDFLVIGDVTIDHILLIADHRILASANKALGTVSLPYPEKVPLTEAPLVGLGGNAYNVVAALQKLGQATGVYTVLGNDSEGERFRQTFTERGVDTSLIQKDAAQGTNSSTILSISGDRVIFTYHFQRDYTLPQLPEVKQVYVTSIGENDRHLFDQILAQKQEHQFSLVFAPGSLQLREDYSDIKPMVEECDLLILNKEEAQMLTHSASIQDEELVRSLAEKGPQRVIMTKSQQGSVAYDHGTIYKVGALPVQVVETTGAGDTYAATVCAILQRGLDLKTAMEYAAVNASHVVCAVGCEQGMLTLEALQQAYSEKHSQLVFQD